MTLNIERWSLSTVNCFPVPMNKSENIFHRNYRHQQQKTMLSLTSCCTFMMSMSSYFHLSGLTNFFIRRTYKIRERTFSFIGNVWTFMLMICRCMMMITKKWPAKCSHNNIRDAEQWSSSLLDFDKYDFIMMVAWEWGRTVTQNNVCKTYEGRKNVNPSRCRP